MNKCCLLKATEIKKRALVQVILAALPSFTYIIQKIAGAGQLI